MATHYWTDLNLFFWMNITRMTGVIIFDPLQEEQVVPTNHRFAIQKCLDVWFFRRYFFYVWLIWSDISTEFLRRFMDVETGSSVDIGILIQLNSSLGLNQLKLHSEIEF